VEVEGGRLQERGDPHQDNPGRAILFYQHLDSFLEARPDIASRLEGKQAAARRADPAANFEFCLYYLDASLASDEDRARLAGSLVKKLDGAPLFESGVEVVDEEKGMRATARLTSNDRPCKYVIVIKGNQDIDQAAARVAASVSAQVRSVVDAASSAEGRSELETKLGAALAANLPEGVCKGLAEALAADGRVPEPESLPSREGVMLTTKEVAAMLEVTESQVRNLVQGGLLKGKKVGWQRFFSPEEVARYQENRRPPGRPPTDSTSPEPA
jgi:excisionase family DNA binding protein